MLTPDKSTLLPEGCSLRHWGIPTKRGHFLFVNPPIGASLTRGPATRKAILAGAVSDWNKENPTLAVQPGDRAMALALPGIEHWGAGVSVLCFLLLLCMHVCVCVFKVHFAYWKNLSAGNRELFCWRLQCWVHSQLGSCHPPTCLPTRTSHPKPTPTPHNRTHILRQAGRPAGRCRQVQAGRHSNRQPGTRAFARALVCTLMRAYAHSRTGTHWHALARTCVDSHIVARPCTHVHASALTHT